MLTNCRVCTRVGHERARVSPFATACPFNSDTRPFMSTYGGVLLKQVQRLMTQSVAAATLRNYMSGWCSCEDYLKVTLCSEHKWGPSDAIITGFIAHLSMPRENKELGLAV